VTELPGLYLHIPFCRHLCPYCDFAVAVRRDPPFGDYVDALLAELRDRRRDYDEFQTVYLGGGTPGLLPEDQLERLLRFALAHAPAAREVTLEANPNDVTDDRVRAWRDLGITRLSIGVQSFDDDYLQRLGRDHSGERAVRAVEVAGRAGLDVSMDLIWGGPHYSGSVLAGDLAAVERLAVGHVSAYELTVETNTVFGRRQRAGELTLPDEDALETFGASVVEGLGAIGFERYEVSSYARRPGARSVHNSGYWLGRAYLGAGMGAHSLHLGGEIRRRRNVRRLRRYLAEPTKPAQVENLSPIQHLRERLFLAARTTMGVSVGELRARFGDLDASIWESVARWQEHGVHLRLLEDDSETIRATAAGLNLADTSAALVWEYV
jgi:oxygen-independent coproporphyrinogen-3 oxidase